MPSKSFILSASRKYLSVLQLTVGLYPSARKAAIAVSVTVIFSFGRNVPSPKPDKISALPSEITAFSSSVAPLMSENLLYPFGDQILKSLDR